MLIFGIDTCCMAATAALMEDERLLGQIVIDHKKTHSQKMMPQIEFLFEQTELDVSEVDFFAAAVGPGSFTGVRIGVATVKAMAQAFKKPCIAVSTLYALANNVSLFDGLVCPILDARRGQVYNAVFENNKRLCDDRAIALDELLEELSKIGKPVIFCGDAISVYREEIKEKLGDLANFAQPMQSMNLAASVAELGKQMALKGETVTYTDLKPEYIRLSQAERERLEKTENNQEGKEI